jgi:hypothetical protein
MQDVLLLHYNARLHTSLQTTEALTKLHWTILPHPPYSLDLAPPDLHLFSPMRNPIHGRKFRDDNEVTKEVML